jgi:bifunctional UDP-N-acetylglucosamine 2-epimerase / N-acetylmannosamine kinase
MKKKRKICFVIVNRANYGRVRNLMKFLIEKEFFSVQILLVSSPVLKKYGGLDKILARDKIKIEEVIYSHIEGENLITMAKSTALLLQELSSSLARLKPDIVFTIGDRYESLATAIASSYLNIFLAHLQGGELSGSIDESIRHAVTKLSNLHLACTKKSKDRIRKMGENPKFIFNVGCPSIDTIKKINFKERVNLKKYSYGLGFKVDLKKPYYVVMIHPDTKNYEKNLKLVDEVFKSAIKLNEQVVWLWPNSDAGANIITKKIRSYREKNKKIRMNFFTNLEVSDYLKLIKNSKCLIGNTSSGIREGSYLSVPYVCVGDRQYMRERGSNVIDCKIDSKKILDSIKKITSKKISKSTIYGNGRSIKKIYSILKNINLDIHKTFYD